MPETRLKEELASLRRRHEAAAARAGETDGILSALEAILSADDPARIGETIFDSFRGLVEFDAAFVLTLDEAGVARTRFSTHPPRVECVTNPDLARVASGRAASLPDGRRASFLWPFLPSGEDPVSVMMVPFAPRAGGGLLLFVSRGFGLYQADEARRLKRFGIVAAQGLSALEEIRLARDFDRMERDREVAHAANVAKSRLLGRVSHELRTPLNGVLGSALLLRMKALPEDCMRTIADIEACGQEMLRLVSDLIEFAGAAANDGNGAHDRPLSVIVGAVADEFRYQASAQGMTIETSIDPRAAALVLPGGSAIRRVLTILIDNAVKYAGAGIVRVEAVAEGGVCRLWVADSGPGMSADLAAAVFEPFRRGDSSRTTPVDGLGLGLPLAARLAGDMGGRIEIDTAPGEGARIGLTLPLPDGAIDEAADDAAARQNRYA